MAGQRSFSVAFNPDKERDLIDMIEDSPTQVIKDALRFYIKYKHLLPELDNTQDLLTIVSQMAVKQAELIEVIARLSERLNGLQMIATPSTVFDNNQQNVYDEMMEFGDDTD